MDESPYRARPQMVVAAPLSLGATSSAEYLEMYLTQKCDPESVRAQLQAQLPAGLALHSVEECEIIKLGGKPSESMNTLLTQVECYVAVQQVLPPPPAPPLPQPLPPQQQGSNAPEHSRTGPSADTATDATGSSSSVTNGSSSTTTTTGQGASPAAAASAKFDVVSAVQALRDMESYVTVHKAGGEGSGEAAREVAEDLRSLLLEVEAVGDVMGCALAEAAPAVVGQLVLEGATQQDSPGWGIIRYVAAKKSDSNVLNPERVVDMLAVAAGSNMQLQLVHVHRSSITLAPPAPPLMDWDQMIKLRSLLRHEGHLGVKRQFGL